MTELTAHPAPDAPDPADAIDPVPGDPDAGAEPGADDDRLLSPGARAFFDWILVVGIALFVAIVVRTFVLAHYQVEGQSMFSTLHPGDRVFVNKLSYRLHDPNRGDVVVLHELTGSTERALIKRVIALPGETIEIDNCEVFINGFRLDEPYLDEGMCTSWEGATEPVLIEPDHVFVMGDNRGQSSDSRSLGQISEDDLVGRAFVVFWPRADWQWL